MRLISSRFLVAASFGTMAAGLGAPSLSAQTIDPNAVLDERTASLTWMEGEAAQDDGQPEADVKPTPRVPLSAQAGTQAAQTSPVQVEIPASSASVPVVQDLPRFTPATSRALLDALPMLTAEGLDPADYPAAPLRTALASGDSAAIDRAARDLFRKVAEDLRSGHTPESARVEWLATDPDIQRFPTELVMREAMDGRPVAEIFASLLPTHADYAALRAALAQETDPSRRAKIRANMDRWRWLPRDLGEQYLMVNVPEYQVRLMMNGNVARSYRAIVGKPGRTATPQLIESVEGVVFNPTWTVPQSIVVGEGLGQRVLNNPAWAKARGYTATRGENGYISVVQQPGPNNSLGRMKLDMPNAHAIFLHDTPARNLFGQRDQALSHGCVRTENALELAYTMMILGEGGNVEEAAAIAASGEYTRVGFQKEIPIYISYFTLAPGADGSLTSFNDIYDRDGPVLASL